LLQLAEQTNCPLRKWRFSLANNHAGDFGEEGIRRTLDLTRDTGCQFFGYRKTPLREFFGQLELDFWGWTQWENRRFDGREFWRHSFAVNRLSKLKSMTGSITEAMGEAKRLRVLFPHWGLEFRHYPNRAQLDQMMNWLRWDFELVVGHHSHVVQPIQVAGQNERATENRVIEKMKKRFDEIVPL
jgi:hypothetical protein